MLYCAFILAYTCVFFLPKMHERYGYLYEILAILIAFVDRKTIIPCVVLNMVSLITYSLYLYGVSYDWAGISGICSNSGSGHTKEIIKKTFGRVIWGRIR